MPKRKIFKSSGLAARVPRRYKTAYSFDDPQEAMVAYTIMLHRLDSALDAIEERGDWLYAKYGEDMWYWPYDPVLGEFYDEADKVLRLMMRSGYIDYDSRI